MKNLLSGIMFLGLASLMYSQSSDTTVNEVKLSDVTVSPINADYMNEVVGGTNSIRVFTLEKKASRYDFKASPSFIEGGFTKIQFSQKNGRIIASFNSHGKILTASEKYVDLKLPPKVRNAVSQEYEGWKLQRTVYSVNYHHKRGAKKAYKIRLTKDGLKKNLTFDVQGNQI